MKILLVNDSGELVASVDGLERYDGCDSGHVFAVLDLLEALIAAAKGQAAAGAPARVVSGRGEALAG